MIDAKFVSKLTGEVITIPCDKVKTTLTKYILIGTRNMFGVKNPDHTIQKKYWKRRRK